MQRGLGEAARSWGGSAVLGVSPMSDCRGSPHSRFAVVSPTRALPWFPPLALCIKTDPVPIAVQEKVKT
ncbi:MAG: hypothetical protein F6K55_47330 [Moorea sp. SIO4A3]|nr:hypothetical protein [Moorena sp. SIO4A3]